MFFYPPTVLSNAGNPLDYPLKSRYSCQPLSVTPNFAKITVGTPPPFSHMEISSSQDFTGTDKCN